MGKNKYLERKDILGHVALVIAFYEKRQLTGGVRWRNGGIWSDDGFAFSV